VLSHSWHFDYIFPGLFRIGSRSRALTVDCVTFFYLLAASTWETNMRLLDAHIKRTSFEDIRRPSTAVNDTLHDARHALTYLQDEVEKISRYMPMSVDRLLRDIGDPNGTPTRSAQSLYPRETLQDILRRANLLERFLMDSFNILVSSTGVVGTELSIAQGIRGQRLSTLAFVYVPLAFVTGIFGMNVAEINGSLLSVWVPVVVTLVIIVLTVAVFVMYSKWTESRWRSRWGGKTPERLSGGRL
jgi:Mg2+ and Co2+ transporter CorA